MPYPLSCRIALPARRRILSALPILAALASVSPLALSNASAATVPPEDPAASLRREILAMDARLSDAYARCRSQPLRALFTHDAELVFADRGVLHGVSAHLDALRREGCRQRRETVAEAQSVYAVPGVAGTLDRAIQVGTQTFCATEARPCNGVRTAFVALWRRTGTGWKIERLIRYGYRPGP